MSKKFYLFTSACLALLATPSFAADQATVGMLGSQSHVKMGDPAVQKAIEMLIKHPPKANEGKTTPNKQDNPLGSQSKPLLESNKVLFLGGPEVVPM